MIDELERAQVDWEDFEPTGEETRALLERLADPPALRRLVDAAADDADAADPDGLVLHRAPERGFVVRLNLHRGGETPPHDHAFSFSTRILAGGYDHTWYDRPAGEDRLAPYLTRWETVGNTYTLHCSAIHAMAVEPGTVSLVLHSPAETSARQPDPQTYEAARAEIERLGLI